MIEETGTSSCNCTDTIPAMQPSISHRILRRSRDADVTTSGTGKRRRFSPQDHNKVFHLQSVNFENNAASTAVSGTSDHVHSVIDDLNHSISDLKAELVSETESCISINGGFSRDRSASSVICSETEEIESIWKKKIPGSMADEATSRRRLSPAETPSAAELEEFFLKAEQYDQKRFAERYNYDIVKDVPMEGRYQWVRLKP